MVKLSLLHFLAAAAVAVEITTTRYSSSSTTSSSSSSSSRPSFLFVRAQEDGEGTTATTDAPVSAPSTLPPVGPSAEDQQCITESTSLNKDPNVGSATQDLLTTTKEELLANFTEFCSIFQRKCTIDLSEYSSNLQQACQAATVASPDGTTTTTTTTTTTNGQFHDYQIVIECRTDTFAPDAIEIPGSVQLDNVPTCIGQSCDPTNLPSEITELLNQLLETLTTEIDNQLGDSFVCQSNINSSGAGGSVRSMGMATCAGAAAATAAAAFTTIMMT
mmetsp:Transcript_11246/g.26698  ORF Transcript_11246/g.26698 Transcript_11246/m.26698 type:complete len:275 (+) Transcript_11246:336-1160(+)|eukprot:CAMPEP_0113475044 /NCGR_PEP_ID=MMETSP0014_2-20120614/18911_1 /TAXON_ID=2857 /ORGANISM="Nitzschia sp." /LENGTH=274 /DNA_ID=CAMNT_0000367939 /DNA_START=51 /DNA_END=875 /DNA_ORIENTATION=+ /assembly_acc=CAM_ASM_000159